MEKVENQEVETIVVTEEVEQVEEVKTEQTIEEVLDSTNETMEKLQEALDERERLLFQREVKSSLKDNGLEAFSDVITITDAKDIPDVVKKLTAIVNDIKVSLSYQPTDNTKQDAYTVHANNKDTKSMIGSKLSNLFK